jgi:hypothetical protein
MLQKVRCCYNSGSRGYTVSSIINKSETARRRTRLPRGHAWAGVPVKKVGEKEAGRDGGSSQRPRSRWKVGEAARKGPVGQRDVGFLQRRISGRETAFLSEGAISLKVGAVPVFVPMWMWGTWVPPNLASHHGHTHTTLNTARMIIGQTGTHCLGSNCPQSRQLGWGLGGNWGVRLENGGKRHKTFAVEPHDDSAYPDLTHDRTGL